MKTISSFMARPSVRRAILPCILALLAIALGAPEHSHAAASSALFANPALAGSAVIAIAFAGVSMNVFDQDAFGTISLTTAIESIPYRPTLLSSMNIFDPESIRTEVAAMEMRNGVISLIQTSARGAPLEEGQSEKREFRFRGTNRLAKGFTLRASEIQNIRAFGSETELQAAQTEVMRRYNGPTGLVNDLALTWEKHRLGAIQGIVLDADNTPLVDWFEFWGVDQPAEVNFALNVDATDVRAKCSAIIRAMARAAKGAWIDGSTQVHALVGDGFWDLLCHHPDVRDTYKNWEAAVALRASLAEPTKGQFGDTFYFGGIYWHNYRGADNFDENATRGAATVGIASTKAKFFPVNAPGAFKWFKSPGETFDFVNTLGLDFYGLMVRDKDRNMWVRPEVYSYPLFACMRPLMLQSGKSQ